MSIVNPKIDHFLEADPDEQNRLWDEAVKLHHEKKYIDSIKQLALYLDKNVTFLEENGKTKFQLNQGSVTIFCRITDQTFYAYINVLKIEYPDPIVFRRLLNLNAEIFSTCKASIVKNFIRLATESLLELASPSKLYWDLFELSTHGDRLDDVLSIYSTGVKESDSRFREEWSDKQKRVGLTYFRIWIKEALVNSEYWYKKNDLYVASWWLLGRIFSVLYFIHPEGKIEEELNEIVEDYNNEERSNEDNIKRLILRLKKLDNLNDEEVLASFYTGKFTFRKEKQAPKELITKYLESSLTSADRFKALGHIKSEYISLIYGLGMLLNNFILEDEITEDLVQIFEVAHPDYMVQCYPDLYKHHIKNPNNNWLSGMISTITFKDYKLSMNNDKDIEVIVKKIRDFYEDVLDGVYF